MEETRSAAAGLLAAVWRGTPADYKSRYRMTIWTQFENQVRSAAYTNNLAKFINQLCLKLNAEPGRNADDRTTIEKIVNSGSDRAILKMLREETTLIVLMVRVANQEKQEEWKMVEDQRKQLALEIDQVVEEIKSENTGI